MSRLPVDRRDFPDPFVLNTGSGFWAYATNGGGSNVQVLFSEDLVRWRNSLDALPALPFWAEPGNTWAPCVLHWKGKYVLFYTCKEPRAGRQAISVAIADRPGGPFVDAGRGPLVYQLEMGGSIDPSYIVDVDGSAYLVWKADSNALNRPSSIWLQRIGPGGTTLQGSPVELLRLGAAWEDPLIEAPSIVWSRGAYYLFYSANWWNSDRYAIGYATAPAVAGPYTRVTVTRPWFASDAQVAGPGGQEWFTDSAGQLRMAYHGWTPGKVGYPKGARSLRLATVDLTGPEPVVQ